MLCFDVIRDYLADILKAQLLAAADVMMSSTLPGMREELLQFR